MAENNEMSNTEKLERLSSLINSSGGEVAEEDFKEILNTLPVELVSTENVRGYGTLLQDAVAETKKNFIQILLAFGADPTATCKDKRETPMELAAKKEEILTILAKYTEIPDKVKLRQLSHLMYEDKPKDETEAKFRSLLGSVPIALVSTSDVRDYGTLLQDAVYENKQNFVRILLESGVDPTAPNPGKDETPMEKALSRGNEEVFNILAEFTETPDRIKLVQLSHIMDKEEAKSKILAEFNNLLSSVSVDMVNSTFVRGSGTLLQYAVSNGKLDFVKALLKFGAEPTSICSENETAPIEIAIKNRENLELSVVLSEVTEMPEKLKLDFLRLCLKSGTPPPALRVRDTSFERHTMKIGQKEIAAQMKKTLESMPLEEVRKVEFKITNVITAMASFDQGSHVYFSLVQMAAAYGKADLLSVFLDLGLDPNAHSDETPPPFLLAAVNGHMEAFEVLAPHAEKNSDSLQFELAQLLVWGMADKVPIENFKDFLGNLTLDKLSNQPLGDSTLLQHLAYMGKRTAVGLLLQYGVDPSASVEKNERTPEEWAFKYDRVGVLVELAKVKEVSPEIMSSNLWSFVQREQMISMGGRMCSLLEKNTVDLSGAQ